MSANPASPGEIEQVKATWTDSTPLRLLYGGSIVVQLGAQLYPSVTASLAELISNAWDADATRVWVRVPLGSAWDRDDATIEVLDNGLGMNRWEAQFFYLVVGRERRRDLQSDHTPSGRRLHGRKGIGKLAAFGTGRTLEVMTKQAGQDPVAFRLDYDALRRNEPGESSPVTELDPASLPALCDPEGKTLDHGTRVRLGDLQAKRRPNPERLLTSMRRRFSLDETQMQVDINGETLTRFDMDFPLRFPDHGVPPGVKQGDGFAVEEVDDGQGGTGEVRWWIGFTDKPVKDELLQGVTVMVRGKQAQRAFKFERTRGTEGQLGYEYLVGEVHADWIDEGIDDEDDLISSDRDTLQLEDERLQPFIDWGRQRLRWALTERQRRQSASKLDRWKTEMPEVGRVLGRLSQREQQSLGRVAERLARVEGVEQDAIAEVMDRVLQVREDHAAERVADEIRSVGDAASAATWERAREVRELERRILRSAVQARLAVLEAVEELLNDGDQLPDLAGVLSAHPWVVDLTLDRSDAQILEPSEGRGAVLLVGAPPWRPDEPPTLLVAWWPGDDDGPAASWTEAVAALDCGPISGRLVIGIDDYSQSGAKARNWKDTLAHTVRQHEAWQKTLTNGAG